VRNHTILSTVVAGVLYAVFRSWELAAASVLAGVLVDLDHFMDYFIEYGPRADRTLFFRSFGAGLYRKIYIPIHGWEWIAICAVIAWLADWNIWWIGMAVGLTHHLIADQIVNGASRFGYSLLWRAAHGFDPAKTFIHAKKWQKPEFTK